MVVFRALARIVRASVYPLLLASAACEDDGPRVYTAQAYVPDEACLQDYAPVDLVTADTLPSTCDPICFFINDQLYVSTVCQPYPAAAMTVDPSSSPECLSAMNALEAGASCDNLPTDSGADGP
jgi:hypothetical protein